jgi:4-aminobutyrate aminotransferase/(S)-3-amino-2-methylpropionate transaminase
MALKDVHLTTEFPGPRSQDLMVRKEKYVARGASVSIPIGTARGEGALVEDLDGNVYIDFAGGIAVLNAGYGHPRIVQAVQEQASRFLHTCFAVTMNEPYVQLAERLVNLCPGDFPKKVVLLNSGAEAVENAVKVARAFTGRPGVMVFDNAFHGRTLLAMTMTGKVRPYKFGFGPFAPEIYRMPFSYCYRCIYDKTYPECGAYCVEEMKYLLKTRVDPEQLAAVVVEPVQGEGGYIPAVKEFLAGLKEMCEANGILFVDDEIQTGFGRTGKMFAIEHSGVVPDLVVMGKSLSAGLPLTAVVGRADAMDAPQVGGLGGTYSGNPVACAGALAVLDVFEKENLVQRAAVLGDHLQKRLKDLEREFACIGDVRGLGPMIALELVKDRKTREPDPDTTKRVLAEANKRGLLIIRCGIYDNVIRIIVPLVVTDAQLDKGLDILHEALRVAAK